MGSDIETGEYTHKKKIINSSGNFFDYQEKEFRVHYLTQL